MVCTANCLTKIKTAAMNLIIKNGIIVNESTTTNGELLIQDGIIKKIAKKLSDDIVASETIDAGGSYIFPGSIDPHVHMHLPGPAGYSSDDFYTGCRAALLGGTTTIIDFVTPVRGQSIISALEFRKKEAEDSLCNYMFHVSPIEIKENTEKELIQCMDLGIRSFKIYMAYKSSIGIDDADIKRVLKIIGKRGGVVAVHCELGDEIEKLRNQFYEQGKTEPVCHALSRPPETEAEAVKRIIQLAEETDCTLYLVHISSAESLEYISKAQKSGLKVFAETCPHYLLLDDSHYYGSFEKAAPFIVSPPLRKSSDNDALWKALVDGTLQAIGTDHCPFSYEQKAAGKNDFRKIPNGAGGVEHRLTLIFTYGVLKSRITLQQFVNLTSTMPAKIFGLFPQKGTITEGSDADIVIWDPNISEIISASTHHQNCDLNIFEGIKTQGKATYVIRNGEIMVKKGMIISTKKGLFL